MSLPGKKLRVRPVGFEPTTCGLEVRCSIQLSYGVLLHEAISVSKSTAKPTLGQPAEPSNAFPHLPTLPDAGRRPEKKGNDNLTVRGPCNALCESQCTAIIAAGPHCGNDEQPSVLARHTRTLAGRHRYPAVSPQPNHTWIATVLPATVMGRAARTANAGCVAGRYRVSD